MRTSWPRNWEGWEPKPDSFGAIVMVRKGDKHTFKVYGNGHLAIIGYLSYGFDCKSPEHAKAASEALLDAIKEGQ